MRKPKTYDSPMNPVSLERFTWSEGKLTAFESDIRNERFNGTYPWLQRLYQDACDVGIAILSHHTGNVERFYLERQETRDGDLLAFYFKPEDKASKVKQVIVFND